MKTILKVIALSAWLLILFVYVTLGVVRMIVSGDVEDSDYDTYC